MTVASPVSTEGQQLRELMLVIIDLVTAHGTNGMPAGHLYAELMTYGCTLGWFEQIMAAIVSTGRLSHRGHVYYAA